jgi:integrase
MPVNVQPRNGRYQLRVIHKLLPKPYFDTFDSDAEARAYGEQLDTLLDRGIIPAELNTAEKRTDNPTLSKIITAYLADSTLAPSDIPTITLVKAKEGEVKLLSITSSWADAWVSKLKVADHLAPSTIKKRVESLSRCLDWYWRGKKPAIANPLKEMPKGYALPTATESKLLKAAGLEEKRDVQRDRRLDSDELARVREALSGKISNGKQRPLPIYKDFAMLFEVILLTGMRLSEAYSLRSDQIDLAGWVINVAGSKGHRGAIKPRTVPMRPALRPLMKAWCRGRVGLLFNFWDGSPEDKRKCTTRLSARFATLFAYAGVADFTEHDLRHEATCEWVSMRIPNGHWTFSETEVCKMMGWTDTRMMLRYASLRGSDLSSRMG